VSTGADLVLLSGAAPGAAFGVFCLASIWSRRPLSFRFALEAIGADTQGDAISKNDGDVRVPSRFSGHDGSVGARSPRRGRCPDRHRRNGLARDCRRQSNLMPLLVAAVVGAWTLADAARERQRERAPQSARYRRDRT
jgi:hypothetical protein